MDRKLVFIKRVAMDLRNQKGRRVRLALLEIIVLKAEEEIAIVIKSILSKDQCQISPLRYHHNIIQESASILNQIKRLEQTSLRPYHICPSKSPDL